MTPDNHHSEQDMLSFITEGGSLPVYASAGVSVAVVMLIAAAVIVISVCVCLRRRKNRNMNTTDNVAYHYSSGQQTMTINEVSTDITANDPDCVDDTYSYATQPTTAVLTSNAAYNAVSRYGRDDKVELQYNDAYPVSVAENSAYQTGGTAISTSGNAACKALNSTTFSEGYVCDSISS